MLSKNNQGREKRESERVFHYPKVERRDRRKHAPYPMLNALADCNAKKPDYFLLREIEMQLLPTEDREDQ